MKEKTNSFYKTNLKGISLIVLIITIIVIIILATAIIISISDNDVIDEADTARYESDRANMQALLTATINEIATQNLGVVKVEATQINTITSGENQVSGEITYTVKSRVDTANNKGTIVFDKGDNTATTYYTGKKLPIYALGETKWYVDSEGVLTLEVAGVRYGGGAFAVFVAANSSRYYGTLVTNYETGDATIDSQVQWQIFHSDGNNIYLIATDYIHNDICPPSVNNTIYKNSDYCLSMNSVQNDYNGSISITDTTLQGLNSKYYAYLTETGTTSGTIPNMKAVSYMLDTKETVWGKFAGEEAAYAIGGPTVELLFDSYNNKYDTEYRYKVESRVGYKISKDNGANWSNNYESMINTTDTQYVISSTDKASGMWLASPSASFANSVMFVHFAGIVGDAEYFNNAFGFRPVVCLKSNVALEAVDGGFAIK